MKVDKALFLLATFITKNVAQDCDQSAVGVDLSQCHPEIWRTSDQTTSAEEPLQISYRNLKITLPIVDQTTGLVVPDTYFNMTAKTYHIDQDGFTASIPGPIWQWAKGTNLWLNISNDVNIDFYGDGFTVDPATYELAYKALNIHTHGLHIASRLKQDDTTREIDITHHEVFNLDLPDNHAGGLYWYHPHTDTVGEIDLTSGTFGMIVVETATDGTEIPDALLELPTEYFTILKFFPDKLTKLANGYIADWDAVDGVYPRNTTYDSVFNISYNTSLESNVQFTEQQTNYTLINGFFKPKYSMISGQWYRFGFLFVAGTDEDTEMSGAKFRVGTNQELQNFPQTSDYGTLSEVSGTKCQTKLLAKDGLYLNETRDLDFDAGNRIWMSHANRVEILMKCDVPNDGATELTDNSFALILDTATTVNRADTIKSSVPIMQFEVTSSGSTSDATGALATQAALNSSYDFQSRACHPSYMPDMTGADVTIANQLPSTYTAEINATIRNETRDLEFYNTTLNRLDIDISPFAINGDYFRGYFADDKALNLSVFELGKMYEIRLTHGHHPMHIHVNPYQLQQDVDDGSGYHKKGDWVDTLTSACPTTGCLNAEPRSDEERAVVRMYMERFWGRMVCHCHNSDHSDSLAFGEFFILPDDDYLNNYVAPAWSDDCSNVMEVQQV